MTGINDLIAAQLAKAAYTPVNEYTYEHINKFVPEGWHAVPYLSTWGGTGEKPDKNNQMITYANDKTRELAHVFKGSDNIANFYSDVANDGYSQWRRMKDSCDRIDRFLRGDNSLSPLELLDWLVSGDGYTFSGKDRKEISVVSHKGYRRFGVGHSLGGGMAQVAAVRYGLSGYTQNALPIPDHVTLETDYPDHHTPGRPNSQSYREALHDWLSGGPEYKPKFLRATIVDGDIATHYYRHVRNKDYINTANILIPRTNVDQVSEHDAAVEALRTNLESDPQVAIARSFPERFGSGLFDLVKTYSGYDAVVAHLGETVIKGLQANPHLVENRPQDFEYYHSRSPSPTSRATSPVPVQVPQRREASPPPPSPLRGVTLQGRSPISSPAPLQPFNPYETPPLTANQLASGSELPQKRPHAESQTGDAGDAVGILGRIIYDSPNPSPSPPGSPECLDSEPLKKKPRIAHGRP